MVGQRHSFVVGTLAGELLLSILDLNKWVALEGLVESQAVEADIVQGADEH